METVTKASEYSDIVIDEGSPINADMVFDKAKNHLYVMTEKKVSHFFKRANFLILCKKGVARVII